jgi:hypothetical protein
MESRHYLEIGKMCMLDSEPRNSETQMISQVIRWVKNNHPGVLFLYTLADGIMGKCGYVYQAANFYYGGEYWTDSYMSAKGEKVHPRTTTLLCKENWKWHYSKDSIGFSSEFRKNHDAKVEKAVKSGSKLPKEQVFWLTPEYMSHIGMKKIKGKMFRYIYPLSKKAKKILLSESDISWVIGSGVYPKESNGALQWKQMVGRKKYEIMPSIPEWDLKVVEHNTRNVNAHRR